MTCSFDVKDGKLVNVQYDGGDFDCRERELTSLEVCPNEVEKEFNCSKNQLTSLRGCPKKISEGWFDCSYNQLTSLEDCPEEFCESRGGSISCHHNQLTTLKGCPKKLFCLCCSYNQLTSLEYCPQKLGWDFDCTHNQLITLKGCPETRGFYFFHHNPNLVDISDLPSICKFVGIGACPKIEKFPKKIDDTLKFSSPTDEVRERIKKVTFYDVLYDFKDYITVRQKRIGAQLLDEL